MKILLKISIYISMATGMHASFNCQLSFVKFAFAMVFINNFNYEFALQVISGRIRAHLGLTEEEYVAKLYSSLGISKLKTANTLKKMRSTAGSRTPFQRLKTLPVRRN